MARRPRRDREQLSDLAAEWQRWAERERNELQLQEIYKQLFNAYVKTTSRSDEYELVIGTVCLAWHPPGDQPVRRHLLVAPLSLDLDDDTGAMTATADLSAGLTLETDMLDPGQIPQAFDIHAVGQLVAEFADHPMDAESVGHLGRRIVHSLGPDSSYSNSLERPAIGSTPMGALCPRHHPAPSVIPRPGGDAAHHLVST